MKYFSHLPFQPKLVVSFTVTFLVILISITILLANVALQRSLDDAKALLSLLTDQVLINVEQTISATEKQIFTLSNSLNIPELMRTVNAFEPGIRPPMQALEYSVNQMVSEVYPFDFVLVRALNGQDIHTGGKIPDGEAVYQQARIFLDRYDGDTWQWIRANDNSVYVVQRIYSLSPLSHVGNILLRISGEKLFALGSETGQLECSLLLFDETRKHILTSGFINSEKQVLISETMRKNELSEGIHTWLGSDYYVVVKDSGLWSMVGLLPMDRLYDVRRDVWLTSLLIAAVGLFIGVLVVILLTNRLTRQLKALTTSIEAVTVGDMKQTVPIYSQDDIGQIAIRFNTMTREIAELLQRVVSEEKHKSEAEFKLLEYRYRSLHTQINSHFIFNALETVNAYAKLKGNKEISKVVQLMSRYFRNNSKNIMRQFIPLHEEFDYLRDYAEIFQYIHGERLVIKFECSDVARDALLPTMILQPVLENALEHGMSAANDQTVISLSAQIVDVDKVAVSIVDDGPGMSDEVKKRIFLPEDQGNHARVGIGLRNVAERLAIIYGDRATITLDSSNNGTCVTITLPLSYIAQLPDQN